MKHHEAILAALPGTTDEISEKTGLRTKVIYPAVANLLIDEVLHIGAWVRKGGSGRPSAIYQAGPGVEAKKLQIASWKEINYRRNINKKKLEAAGKPKPKHINAIPTVQQAMKTQPNSIWAYAVRCA